ncbi:hypothetical protein [Actinomycetospora termitidis]|uniref:Uncharacterized protein n=1 Tax=Actinomycetospora termitidis TaxID=3053470 RepID=A0ABT7M3V3_9PSEU|nr:hypothetical protein [Actinomycetospora sp. Odt1-22]MDL5154692.1 hypothetical protein [Actinomycetospora sp. Odt1-22]
MGVHTRVTEQGVLLRFTGRDRLYAFRGGVFLPIDRVLGARTLGRRDAVLASPRVHLPGISVPGVLRAGAYGVGERRQLWMVHAAPTLLAIYLRGEPFHRVVVEVDDPAGLSKIINDALPPRGLPPARRSPV